MLQAKSTRPLRLLAVVGTAGLLAGVVGWAAGSPLTAARDAAAPDFSTALAAAAGLAGWLVVVWLALTVAATCSAVAAKAPGAAGRFAASAYQRLGPLVWRRAVECAVGFVLAGGALAGPALSASATPAAPAPVAVAPFDLDRPVAGSPAPAPEPGFVDLDRPAGATGGGYTPTAPPPAPRAVSAAAADAVRLVAGGGGPERGQPDDGYVVRRGDTLWDIAARHLGPGATAAQIARAWPAWYAANRHVIGADPAHILPGQHLRAPSP